MDCLIVYNKVDLEPLLNSTIKEIQQYTNAPIVEFSAKTNFNINCVIETLKSIIPETAYQKPSLLKGLINRGDIVLLITSNDSEAPEGRLILPQVMALS